MDGVREFHERRVSRAGAARLRAPRFRRDRRNPAAQRPDGASHHNRPNVRCYNTRPLCRNRAPRRRVYHGHGRANRGTGHRYEPQDPGRCRMPTRRPRCDSRAARLGTARRGQYRRRVRGPCPRSERTLHRSAAHRARRRTGSALRLGVGHQMDSPPLARGTRSLGHARARAVGAHRVVDPTDSQTPPTDPGSDHGIRTSQHDQQPQDHNRALVDHSLDMPGGTAGRARQAGCDRAVPNPGRDPAELPRRPRPPRPRPHRFRQDPRLRAGPARPHRRAARASPGNRWADPRTDA